MADVVKKVDGMGAIVLEKGTFFRVWAPHADQVYVTGTFDEWAKDKHELEKEDGGLFAGFVEAAKEGDEYQFYLKTPAGDFMRNDPYARQMVHSNSNGVIASLDFDWEGDDFQLSNWNELVIYEMHIGTFNREEAEQPGDFHTAIERLDYLQELGVNAIELMPVTEFPGDLSWGYNPSHPFAVEESYGGGLGLKKFIREAHKKGIAVIIDVVYNHFGPSDLDLWQFDGWSENGGGGIYFYNDWRAKTPWGHTRPDYGRPEVRQYIHDNALMWLEEYKADGLRMDMTAYIRTVSADGDPGKNINEGYEMLRWINKDISNAYPNAIVIAEDMHGLDMITGEIGNGGLGYGTQWDAKFVHTMRDVLIQSEDAHRNLRAAEAAILHRYNNDAFERVIYTESHDEVANGKSRLPEEIDPGKADNWFSRKKAALGMIAVMTSPGIPMIFQGQPLLEDKWFSDTDPLDWDRLSQFEGNVRLYQDLIRLRRNREGQTAGLCGQHTKVLHLSQEQGILVYQRWKEEEENDSVVVVLNFFNVDHENITVQFPFAAEWTVRFNSDSTLYDESYNNLGNVVVTADEHGQATLSIAGYTGKVLTL